MINELDAVILTHDIAEHGLQQDDVGVVVHCHDKGEAFEVEFVTAEGQTLAVLTLTPSDILPIRGNKILHVRELATT